MHKYDVSAKIVEYNKCHDNYSNSNIKIEISGITFHYANMLRRVIKTYIPTYAFPSHKIKITKNTSIINNDQIRERFSNMPIMYIKNTEDTVNDFLKLYDTNPVSLKEFLHTTSEDEKENNKNINNFMTMYISYKNNTGKLKMVTTDMAKFYYNGKEIKSPYKLPFLLVKLHDNEEIECTCQAELGLNLEEKFDSPAIYDPVAGCAYEQITNSKFIINYESKQQFDEIEIFRRALSCLIMRLQYLDNIVKEKVEKDALKEGMLNITNEDMTLGGILGYLIQMHKDVEYAGDHQPNIAVREIHIRYRCKTNIVTIFSECIETLIDSINQIATQLKLKIIYI
jgi:DNA-directed RNA polymerase subunit L